MSGRNQDELTRRIAATLDRGLKDLDPGVERGLARARARALERAERAERASAWRRWLVPAGSLAGAAAAVLLAVTLLRTPGSGPQVPAVPGPVAQAPATQAPQPRALARTEAPQAPAAAAKTPAARADNTGTTAATAALAEDGDLDILAASENLDLYEDLDFFAWLAEDGNGRS